MQETKKKKEKVIKIDTEELERQYQEENEENPLKKAAVSVKKSGAIDIFVSGAKLTFKGILFIFKQLLSLMSLGVKGSIEGFKEASNVAPKQRARSSHGGGGGGDRNIRYVDNRRITVVNPPEQKKKPFWHIPTREEEKLERMGYL